MNPARSELAVSFTGSRQKLTGPQRVALANLLATLAGTRLVHGDAVGADAEADALAKSLGYATACYPGNIAGERAFCCVTILGQTMHPLDRNKDIVAAGDLLIACPAEPAPQRRSGTWQTVRLAQAKGLPVVIVWPDGEIDEAQGRPPIPE